MSDKMSEVYEAYDMEIYQTMRGRGATLLKTDKGYFQLKIPEVNESRLNAEYQLKEKLFEIGFTQIDRCIKNVHGELVTFDRYNNPYVMRRAFDGKECNVNNPVEIQLAVENLAKLHFACRKAFESTESDVHIRLSGDFRRRNQELKRVRSFVGRQKSKKVFEELYIKAFDYFYGQALECEKEKSYLQESGYENTHLGYCHGMYNQHSILFSYKDNGDVSAATVNFDKFYVGNQLDDLYHFVRKIVEKNNYDVSLMFEIIECYGKICPLSRDDMDYIYKLYSYPEKFYKISNQYINAPKNWISPKMLEKLTKVIQDEERKKDLLEKLKEYIN